MKNKKGSHLGILFSLIIFVGFLVFLYIIAAPGLTPQKDKTLSMEQLKVKLPESFSTDLTEITVLVFPPDSGCATINHPSGFETLNHIVKDKNNDPVPSNSFEGSLEITFGVDTFYKLFYSEEVFEDFPRSGACDPITTPSIESLKTNKKVFETKITEFITIYESDYGELKESLNIAFETDFNFKFTNEEDVVVGPEITDKTLEVYVEEIPLEYIDSKANLNQGILTISVW